MKKILFIIFSSTIFSSCFEVNEPVTPTLLDCNKLSPDKVYLMGTLSSGTEGLDALFLPQDPTDFCVGFTGSTARTASINSKGEYIWADNKTIYRFNPENLKNSASDSSYDWEYPPNVLDNETAIVTTEETGCGIGNILTNPINDEILYTCPSALIHHQNQTRYFTKEIDFLTITKKGQLVLSGHFGALKLVSSDLSESFIDISVLGFNPTDVVYHTAKNQANNEDQLWIAMYYRETKKMYRIGIDLNTLNITNEGAFSEPPLDIDLRYEAKLDGKGNLWQLAWDSNFHDLVVKRPLQSLNLESTVEYNDANAGEEPWIWKTLEKPYLKLHPGALITGP